jgi:hypothetical protein
MVGRKFRAAVSAVLLSAFAAIVCAQELTVTAGVDRAQVSENESFTYSVRAEGRVRGEPDVSVLEQDFDILTRTSNTRIQIVNGQTQQVAEWVYQLMPRRAGQFTLPPAEVGGVVSNAVALEVEPAVAVGDEPADIFIEIEADPLTPYVQSQVIYTLRLFVGVSTGRATLTAPQISGGEAIVERLGEDQQFQTVRGGRNFVVRERRYAVFPQQTGPLTIGPATFEAMVIPNRGFSRVQRLRSGSLELDVRPAVAPPPEYPNAAWLPARNLELTETWADRVEEFSLGVPRTRTLTIEADGILETQLPELRLDQVDGVRQYPDQPELDRQVTDLGLQGQRIERFAVIAQRSGDLQMPGVELPWWNIATERWEVARIEPRTVTVQASSEPALAPAPAAPLLAPTPVPADVPAGYWSMVSAALALGWAATVAFMLRHRWVRPKRQRTAPAPSRRAGNRQLLRRLRAACAVNDAAETQRLLLEWAQLRFSEPPQSLGALAQKLPGELAKAVAELELAMYGRSEAAEWRGARLSAALADIDSVSRPSRSGGEDPLLPLYR